MPEYNVYRYNNDPDRAGASLYDLMAKITADSELQAMAILAAQDATVDNIGQTGHYAACRVSAWVTQDFVFKAVAEAIVNESAERRTVEIGHTA